LYRHANNIIAYLPHYRHHHHQHHHHQQQQSEPKYNQIGLDAAADKKLIFFFAIQDRPHSQVDATQPFFTECGKLDTTTCSLHLSFISPITVTRTLCIN